MRGFRTKKKLRETSHHRLGSISNTKENKVCIHDLGYEKPEIRKNDIIAVELGIKRKNDEFMKVVAMLDTGACISLIEEEFIQTMNIVAKKIDENETPIFAVNHRK